jgi:hypothetical protein
VGLEDGGWRSRKKEVEEMEKKLWEIRLEEKATSFSDGFRVGWR